MRRQAGESWKLWTQFYCVMSRLVLKGQSNYIVFNILSCCIASLPVASSVKGPLAPAFNIFEFDVFESAILSNSICICIIFVKDMERVSGQTMWCSTNIESRGMSLGPRLLTSLPPLLDYGDVYIRTTFGEKLFTLSKYTSYSLR